MYIMYIYCESFLPSLLTVYIYKQTAGSYTQHCIMHPLHTCNSNELDQDVLLIVTAS